MRESNKDQKENRPIREKKGVTKRRVVKVTRGHWLPLATEITAKVGRRKVRKCDENRGGVRDSGEGEPPKKLVTGSSSPWASHFNHSERPQDIMVKKT